MTARPTYVPAKGTDARLCDDRETEAAIQLYDRLRADPVAGLSEGYQVRMDYAGQLTDTIYISHGQGRAGMVKVLTLFCPAWRAWTHVPPDRVLWNPLPAGVMVFAYEFFTERRWLH